MNYLVSISSAAVGIVGILATWMTARAARKSAVNLERERRESEHIDRMRNERLHGCQELLSEFSIICDEAKFIATQSRILKEHKLIFQTPDFAEKAENEAKAKKDAHEFFLQPLAFDLAERKRHISRLSSRVSLVAGPVVRREFISPAKLAPYVLLTAHNAIKARTQVNQKDVTRLEYFRDRFEIAIQFEFANPHASLEQFEQHLASLGWEPMVPAVWNDHTNHR